MNDQEFEDLKSKVEKDFTTAKQDAKFLQDKFAAGYGGLAQNDVQELTEVINRLNNKLAELFQDTKVLMDATAPVS